MAWAAGGSGYTAGASGCGEMVEPAMTTPYSATLAATGGPAAAPASDAEVGAGSVLAGRYRLVRLVGRGGMGSVWEGEHLTLHTPVAVKLINPGSADERARARFLREAQAAAGLRSPHVVQIFDYGVHESTPYIAMELLTGETLADRLDREGRLSPAMTLELATHVVRAVARAHEGELVHRDLKPDNIFIVASDAGEIAKVLDFGIAKAMVDDSADVRTRTGAIIGTPYYMSPEQLTGASDLDGRADLWSIAVIVYECLVGRRPFVGDSLAEIVVGVMTGEPPPPSTQGAVPPGFDAWFARAIRRDPGGRFQTAHEMLAALTPILRADAATEERVAPRTRWRWPVVAALVVTAAVAALGVARGRWREESALPSPSAVGADAPAALPISLTATPREAPSAPAVIVAPTAETPAPPSEPTASEGAVKQPVGVRRPPPVQPAVKKRDEAAVKGFDPKELEY